MSEYAGPSSGLARGLRVVPEQTIDYVTKAICIFVFVIPLDGFYYFSHTIGYSVPTIVGYATFIICLPRLFSLFKTQPAAFWMYASVYAVGTIIAVIASILRGKIPGIEVLSIWQMILLAALVCYASVSEEGGRAVLHSLVLGIIFTMIVYLVLYSIDFDVLDFGDRVFKVAGYQANAAGDVAVLGVLLILGTYRQWQRRTKYFILLVGVPLSLYVIWLTNSRAAISSFAFALAVYLVLDKVRSLKHLWMLIFPLLVFVYVVRSGAVQSTAVNQGLGRETARWTGNKQEGIDVDYVARERSEIISQGLQLALENPLGYGLGNSPGLIGSRVAFPGMKEVDPHSDYLGVLLECGVIGLGLYVVGLFMLFSVGIRVFRQDRLLWPLLVLTAMSLMSLSHSLAFVKITWIPLGLVFGLAVRENRKVIDAANQQEVRMALYRLLFRSDVKKQALPSSGLPHANE